MFKASFGLWTHKDHISHNVPSYLYLIGLCHICNKLMVRFLCIDHLMTHVITINDVYKEAKETISKKTPPCPTMPLKDEALQHLHETLRL